MASNNHQLFDKRLKKPVVYRIKDVNQDVTVVHLENFKIGQGSLRFRSPNVVALFLSASDKAHKNAIVIYSKLIEPNINKREIFEYTEHETVDIFDYLEYIQTSIIMLYSAVESLVNLLIPDEFIIEELTNKGTKEIWDKTSIERWKGTSDKLTKVLPEALQITSPAQFSYWSIFKEFEQLRNDIIHVKKESVVNPEETKKIIGLLLNQSVFKKIKAANDLVMDLSKLTPNHYEFPILNNSETLEPIVINSWSDLNMKRID